MEWRTTKVDLVSHVFESDIEEVGYALNWFVIDKSTGTIVCGLDNARLCVRNSKLDVVVRVADTDIPNEHEILEVVSSITDKTIRSID